MNNEVNFDINSANSIIDFAKQLKNQTLRQACGSNIEKHGFKGEGNFGQILEKFYFGYEPNSKAEPDFVEVGIELKSSPLKTLKKGEIVKEVTQKGIRKTNLPKKTENRISHVRPHAKNSADTYELPIKDKVTGSSEYTKHSFWLNDSYIRDEIFLK